MSTRTQQLTDQGVSIWIDGLASDLAELVATRNVSGITTNPTIFQHAIGHDKGYDRRLAELAAAGVDADEAIFRITTAEVRDACDVLRPVHDRTDGVDGRASIEVSPDLAHDTAATIAQARRLWEEVDRDNAYVKIPATEASLPAITASLAAGICVNVTLIFSLQRYRHVIDAYLTGIEQARAAGLDISRVHSVASFFVSRVDTETDRRLAASGADTARRLMAHAGIANARLAYEMFQDAFAADRATTLLAAGGRLQRPLWASTSTKDPALPDTLYVTSLIAPHTVNTMPEKTLHAVSDHADITGDTITGNYPHARRTMAELAGVGIDFDDVTRTLEDEGVATFVSSWHGMHDTVNNRLNGAPARGGSS